MIGELRPYQAEVFDAIARSVSLRERLTLSAEIARQGHTAHLLLEVDEAQPSLASPNHSPLLVPSRADGRCGILSPLAGEMKVRGIRIVEHYSWTGLPAALDRLL